MTKLKRRIAIFLVLAFVLSFGGITVSANGGISVLINEKPLIFDVQPQLINGRTMVPMRKIFEALGAVVTWDDATQTVSAKKDDIIINMTIDSKVMFKNGTPKTLDVPPTLINSRTLVPVRAIAESLNCDVQWIDATQTVKITTNSDAPITKPILSAAEISERVSPSVFYIEVFNSNMTFLGSGSGFFVTNDGVAVTNYHVIKDSAVAAIQTHDGEVYEVTGVLSFDESLDVAIIKVSQTSLNGITVSGFPVVTLADSDNIKTGQNVFTIGSPEGMQNTISNGIISNKSQTIGNDTFIQISAPISHGSSGGALINEYGEILGITSAGIDTGENIGFAIPINVINRFDFSTPPTPYSDFYTYTAQFVLEVYPTTVDLEIGESYEVYVYADGRSEDWSIYWEQTYGNIISCEWGDWLEDNPSICPLIITALAPGSEIVSVYSDVDFIGKDIQVNVTGPWFVPYTDTYITVPDFEWFTGLPLSYINDDISPDIRVYSYTCTDYTHYFAYIDYLISLGFTLVDSEDTNPYDNITSYVLSTPDGQSFVQITDAMVDWGQVWVYIPR